MASRGRPFEPTEKQRGQVEAMHAYGIPEQAIADKLEISRHTLRKYFETELKTGATTANAAVGEFLFGAITGKTVKDERARVTAAIFWAKTRMNWKETSVHQHEGADGGPIEVSTVRERIARRIARLSAEGTTSEDPEESE